jgi:hypothetical protein
MKSMNDAVDISMTSNHRKKVLGIAIAAPVLILGYWAILELISGGTWQDVVALITFPFSLAVLGLFWLLGAPFVYWVYFKRKIVLIFRENTFERTGFRAFKIYQGPVNYEDVDYVRRGIRRQLVIEQVKGKDFLLAPNAYVGGSEAIFAELRRRIPADRFEENLERRLFQKTGREWRAVVFYLTGILLIMASSFSEGLANRARRDLAWKTEIEVNFREETIEDFEHGEDGSLWLLMRNKPGEYEDPQNYEVQHLTASGTDTIKFPPSEILYPEGPMEIGPNHPESFTLTKEGLPRVYMFLVDPFLVWTGSEWEWEEPPRQETARGPSYLEIVLNGPYRAFWEMIIELHTVKVTIPSTGTVEEIDLGEDIEEYAFSTEAVTYGWTLLRLRSPDRRFFVLSYKDDPSEGTWFEVELEGLPLGEFWDIVDYKPGPTGEIHVLIREDVPSCENGVVSFIVGRLDPDGNAKWNWRRLQYPEDCEYASNPDEFTVDVRGRIWIAETGKIVAYDASVFDKPQAEADDRMIYTKNNSGYSGSFRFRLNPDGRLWSLDSLGETLVWLDPDVDNLEEPLPAWVDQLSNSVWIIFILPVAGVVVVIIGGIVAQNEGYFRRNK